MLYKLCVIHNNTLRSTPLSETAQYKFWHNNITSSVISQNVCSVTAQFSNCCVHFLIIYQRTASGRSEGLQTTEAAHVGC